MSHPVAGGGGAAQAVRRELASAREPLTKEQSSLFNSCQGLVRSLAWRIQQKMGSMVELEDLIAYGQLGLVEAARTFDTTRGYAFTTFAHYRIRGAILDGLQKLNWFNKAAFHGSKYEYLAHDFLAGEQAVAAEGDAAWLTNASRSLAVSYILSSDQASGVMAAEMVEDGSSRPAGADLMNEELHALVRRAVDSLPPQVAQLIRCTYFEGMNLKEAGEKLGISKAWASRLHARALGLLAARLHKMGYEPS